MDTFRETLDQITSPDLKVLLRRLSVGVLGSAYFVVYV